MKKTFTLSLLIAAAVAGLHLPAAARDTTLHMSFQDLLDSAEAKEKLDGSVKFYLAGSKTPRILERKGSDVSNPKTNAFGKSAEISCNRAALSALLNFEKKAKSMGANAVVDIVSYYKREEVKSATEFECHDGVFITGVAFKGTYAKVPE